MQVYWLRKFVLRLRTTAGERAREPLLLLVLERRKTVPGSAVSMTEALRDGKGFWTLQCLA